MSLTSCVQKTYERMVKARLQWWLEKNAKLPDGQYGFRKSRSVWDAQCKLITDTYIAFSHRKRVLGLILDVSDAYDNVILHLLGEKLVRLGLPNLFVNNIMALVSNRNSILYINGSPSELRSSYKRSTLRRYFESVVVCSLCS
ncbi:MAG: reverse transcriptase domain-containing protein [Symbiopectobacterium sp.]